MMEGLIIEEKECTDSGSGSPVINSDNSSPPVSEGYSSGGAGVVAPPEVNLSIGVVPGGGVTAAAAVGLNGIDSSGKKKRGRPRKYDENGNLNPSYIKSTPPAVVGPQGFYLTSPTSTGGSGKKGRGRLAGGSGSYQLLGSLGEMYMNTAGVDFTPHLMQVKPGEDIAEMIFSLVLNGSRGVCVISANGTISNVTLRQPCSAGGTLTYEGCFEILALSGSYTLEEKNGIKARSGSLSVSLAGPDGRVIGGGIAGMLRAAGPIQMVVGSFNVSNGGKEKKKRKPYGPRSSRENSAPAFLALPVSQASPNGTLFPSPLPQPLMTTPLGEAANNFNSTYNNQIPTASNVSSGWNGVVEHAMEQRASPDINMSAPMEE